MNIPGITRALELDDADWDLAMKLRGLTEHQREQFSAALGPVKVQKKSSERTYERCTQCSKTKGHGYHKDSGSDSYHEFQSAPKPVKKSTRAASLQQQISGTGSSLIQPPAGMTRDSDDSTHARCQFTRSDGKLCLLLPDHNIHHLPTAMDYHEFVAPSATNAATGSGD